LLSLNKANSQSNPHCLSHRFLEISRWMGLLCAFGIPWSNACFNIGFYCMLIFFILSLTFVDRFRAVFTSSTVVFTLLLFILISLGTIYTQSAIDLAKYDFIHYRKLLAVPLFLAIFTTYEHKMQLFISYCLGCIVLMTPTLLDGLGIANSLNLDILARKNAAYSTSMNGASNLVYWRNQIVHGFHISVLFSACVFGVINLKRHQKILFLVSCLCAIDLLFFIYGRMALLSLLVAIITITLLSSPSKKQILRFFGIIAIVSAAIVLTTTSIQSRLASISNEATAYSNKNDITTSGGIRLHYWQKSWQLFKDSPLIGNGSGSFRQSLISSHDPLASIGHRHTHNEYLTQLAQYGIIGFGLLLALIIISIRNARSIESLWLSNSITTAITIFAFNALTDSSLHNDWEGWAFVLFVSIAAFNIKTNDTLLINNTSPT
jgi:O-antigen ligase